MPDIGTQLRVNRILCSGHGVCAELLPELVALDEWGYPVIADAVVPARLARAARRAVTDCPALALRLGRSAGPGVKRARRGDSEVAQMPDRADGGRLGA
jgi:ferredoxin